MGVAVLGSYHCHVSRETAPRGHGSRSYFINAMFVQSFGSGSSGNAIFVRSRRGAVLIDCGLSPSVLARSLASHKARLSDIDAILVTHEHGDHVRGLDAALDAGCPVHATRGTAGALELSSDRFRGHDQRASFTIAGLTILSFATSHDAAEPCGYSITDGETRVTVVTDLGETCETSAELIAESQLIVIEANHDVSMLRSGPYPQHLKRRVLSSHGHLSNADCGAFLSRCLASSKESRTIWLAHLSATNNRPELAVRTVQDALAPGLHAHDVIALPRRQASPVWEAGQPVYPAQLALFA